MSHILKYIKLTVSRPRKAWDYFVYKVFSIWGSHDYVPFVILSRARSGSNLLRSHMNSHGNIRVEAELLNWRRARSISAVVASIFGKQPLWVDAKGFKVFYYHPNDGSSRDLWECLAAIPKLKLVELVRSNFLDVVVSRALAEKTDQWIVEREGNSSHDIPITVKLDVVETESLFLSMTKEREKCLAFFQSADIPLLTIDYMVLVKNPEKTMAEIAEFLGVQVTKKSLLGSESDSLPQRQRSRKLEDIIENYDEISDYFLGSQWAHFFEIAHE